jgi:hypothetical protein
MKQVYQTDDGATFQTRKEAEAHEREVMQEWLDCSIVGSWVAEVLETMSDEDPTEYFGTYRDMGKCFRDAAYALSLKKAAKYAGRDLREVLAEMIYEAESTPDPEYVEITDDDSHFIRSEN